MKFSIQPRPDILFLAQHQSRIFGQFDIRSIPSIYANPAHRRNARIQQQQLQEQQQQQQHGEQEEEQEDDPLRMDDEGSVLIGQNGEQYEEEHDEDGLPHEEGLQVNDDDWEEVTVLY